MHEKIEGRLTVRREEISCVKRVFGSQIVAGSVSAVVATV